MVVEVEGVEVEVAVGECVCQHSEGQHITRFAMGLCFDDRQVSANAAKTSLTYHTACPCTEAEYRLHCMLISEEER